jgi:streptogramin lyase
VLWSVPIPASDGEDGWPGPRPVAWEAGLDEEACTLSDNPRLWVGWHEPDIEAGMFRRLDGATGDTLDEVEVEGWGSGSYGPYGGAVDREGNFWAIGHGGAGKVVRIDAQTVAVTLLPNPGPDYSFYGLALDAEGQLWIGGRNGNVANYDPVADQWTDLGFQGGVLRGIAVDREGRAFAAGNSPCRLVEVDTITKTVTGEIALPGCQLPVGVSVDVEGYVWVVDQWASTAFKVDPDTHAVIVSSAQLDSPYTYSDMTGAGLNLVAHPPAG